MHRDKIYLLYVHRSLLRNFVSCEALKLYTACWLKETIAWLKIYWTKFFFYLRGVKPDYYYSWPCFRIIANLANESSTAEECCSSSYIDI